MFEDLSLLALIPARSGSKGLPNKNTLQCAGKPLIEWSISAAQKVNYIDDVLVTTDSEEIASISMNAGASIPFLRPAFLAEDDSSMLDVIKHAWDNHLSKSGQHYDYVVLLQPTSPLRTSNHIKEAIDFYFTNCKSGADTLSSVYPVSQKHGWLMEATNNSEYINAIVNFETIL